MWKITPRSRMHTCKTKIQFEFRHGYGITRKWVSLETKDVDVVGSVGCGGGGGGFSKGVEGIANVVLKMSYRRLHDVLLQSAWRGVHVIAAGAPEQLSVHFTHSLTIRK